MMSPLSCICSVDDVTNAVKCYEYALKIEPELCEARENLDNLYCHLVDRWHYRMLNDTARNKAFQKAITNAVTVGCDAVIVGCDAATVGRDTVTAGCDAVTVGCDAVTVGYKRVLDIGAGTGLLRFVNNRPIHRFLPRTPHLQISFIRVK